MTTEDKAMRALNEVGRPNSVLARFSSPQVTKLAAAYDKHIAPREGLYESVDAVFAEHAKELESSKATDADTEE